MALEDAWALLASAALMLEQPIPPSILVNGSRNSTCGEYAGSGSSCLLFDAISRDSASPQVVAQLYGTGWYNAVVGFQDLG